MSKRVQELLSQWEQPEQLEVLKGLRMSGATFDDIADTIGIGRATLFRWIDSNEQIKQALAKDKITADYEVEKSLFQTAINGNVQAQITWLCNRCPEKWSRNGKHKDISADIQIKANTGVQILSADEMEKLNKANPQN